MISPVQCRMARVGLRLGYREAAKLVHCTYGTLQRFELNQGPLRDSTIERIQAGLTRLGARFYGPWVAIIPAKAAAVANAAAELKVHRITNQAQVRKAPAKR